MRSITVGTIGKWAVLLLPLCFVIISFNLITVKLSKDCDKMQITYRESSLLELEGKLQERQRINNEIRDKILERERSLQEKLNELKSTIEQLDSRDEETRKKQR